MALSQKKKKKKKKKKKNQHFCSKPESELARLKKKKRKKNKATLFNSYKQKKSYFLSTTSAIFSSLSYLRKKITQRLKAHYFLPSNYSTELEIRSFTQLKPVLPYQYNTL
jgi:hypothetical protein